MVTAAVKWVRGILNLNGNLYYAALVDLSRKKLCAIKAWQAGDFCDLNLNNFQRKKGKKGEILGGYG